MKSVKQCHLHNNMDADCKCICIIKFHCDGGSEILIKVLL